MGKEHLKQLNDRDPAKRKAAVKGVARELDRDALKKLALMCEDDPDPEIRELARKAGVYIRQQLGEIKTPEAPDKGKTDKPKPPPPVKVTADQEQRANQIVNSALTMHLNGNSAKAMKILAEAMKVNPNLRYDSYFISVVQNVTGIDTDEAFAKLTDKGEFKNAIEREGRQKLQKEIDQHNEKIAKGSWRDVIFDYALFAGLLIIGAMILLFVTIEMSKRYLRAYEANLTAVNDAIAEGRLAADTFPQVYISLENDSSGKPIRFTEFIPDPNLFGTATNLRNASFVEVIPTALITTGIMLTITFLTALAGHVIATILGGVGRLPYYIHMIATVIMTRALGILLVSGLLVILAFEANGGSFLLLATGGVALLNFSTAYEAVKTTAASYNFNIVKAGIAFIPGIVLFGLFGVIIF
ncbi:MAG: HEAT repeat domain-containing protein [Anaerolineae bacterium]|jgi:hypothetical protein|nr:HEAT repeat domain-containing protein [Anaerolineae bacterium]